MIFSVSSSTGEQHLTRINTLSGDVVVHLSTKFMTYSLGFGTLPLHPGPGLAVQGQGQGSRQGKAKPKARPRMPLAFALITAAR